jgi:hypothetical protein
MSLDGRLIIALFAATFACSSGVSPSPPTETPMLDSQGKPIQSQPSDVHLQCDVRREGDTLRLRFEVKNSAREPIHVFDDRGRGDLQPNLLCDGGGGAVHVLYGVPEIPPGVVPYWKFHPKTTKLIPGESVRREATIKIPLREVDSYYPVKYDAHRAVQVSRLGLRVDFVRQSKVTPSDYPDEPRGELGSVSCEAALPGPVELQRRGDPFTRI